MDKKVKTETTRTEITGQIGGVDVRINYENKTGAKPDIVRAFANIVNPNKTDTPGMLPGFIGTVAVDIQVNGQKNIHIAGAIPTLDGQALATAMEEEINLIFAEN